MSWRFRYDNDDYSIIGACPSISQDVLVSYKGNLISSSQGGKYIADCNGELVVFMGGNDFLDDDTSISHGFMDSNGEMIAYSDGEHFDPTNIKIRDMEGKTIATLRTNEFPDRNILRIDVYDQDHIMSDPSVLMAISGITLYNENLVICNMFVIVVLPTVIIIIVVIMVICYYE